MLDGSGTGLLGKKLPDFLSVGAFNAMYIAAVATSLGRTMGNITISIAGANHDTNFQDEVFIPLTILSLVIVVFVLIFFRTLDANVERRKIK